jgi:hypothetical protein
MRRASRNSGCSTPLAATAGVVAEQPSDLTPPAIYTVTVTASAITLSQVTAIVNPVTGDEVEVPPPKPL